MANHQLAYFKLSLWHFDNSYAMFHCLVISSDLDSICLFCMVPYYNNKQEQRDLIKWVDIIWHPIAGHFSSSVLQMLSLPLVCRLDQLHMGLKRFLPTVKMLELRNLQSRLGWVTKSCLIHIVDIGKSAEGINQRIDDSTHLIDGILRQCHLSIEFCSPLNRILVDFEPPLVTVEVWIVQDMPSLSAEC